MHIEFDSTKRNKTMDERSLDFAKAGLVFAAKHLTREDIREDYDEQRFQTAGWLEGRRQDGDSGLDATRRGSPYYFNEESK